MTTVVRSLVMQGHLGNYSPAIKVSTNAIKPGRWRGLEGALEPEHEALLGGWKSWGGTASSAISQHTHVVITTLLGPGSTASAHQVA